MVRRSRETIALGLLLTLVSAGVAQDLPAPIPAGLPTAAARKVPETTVSAKRRRLEQKLQTPAAVPLEGRKTITLDEFIQHVRDQHHIAIRLDLANLRTVPFGEMSGTTSCGPSACGVYSVREMSCGPAACAVPSYGGPIPGIYSSEGAPLQPAPSQPAPSQPAPLQALPPAASYSVADDIGAGVSLQVVQATSLTAGALIVSGGAGTATEKTAGASENPIRGDVEKPLVDQLRANPRTSVVAEDSLAGDSSEIRSSTNQGKANDIARALRRANLQGTGIEIEVRGDRVVVSGSISKEEDRKKAVAAAESVSGNARVVDRLVVAAPKQQKPSKAASTESSEVRPARHTVDGETLTSSVLAPPRSKAAPKSADAEITYRLVDGKAILTGRAASEEQKRKAEAFARFLLDNPEKIENRITVVDGEQSAAAKQDWYKDFEKAEAEAKRLGLPLVIQFHASWCGPCQQMKPILNDPEIKEHLGKSCLGVKVDIDTEKAVASRFNISSIPATIVLDPDGEILSTNIGMTSKQAFLRQMAQNTKGTDRPRVKAVSGTEDDSPAAPKEAKDEKESDEEPETSMDALRHQKVALADLALEDATIESALRQILEALAPPVQDIDTGVPVRLTCMFDLDYLVLDDSVLVTTKLAANLRKETRVYRLPVLPNCPPDQVAKVISQSVRPWSWRSQVTDIAQQFVTQWPKSAKLPIQLDMQQGLKLASGDATGDASTPSADSLTADGLAALGPMLSAGGVVMVQAGMAALEIMHHGDPPTGVIQTLPGMLIITQSQSAHREIAELIEQLTEAAAPAAPASLPSY